MMSPSMPTGCVLDREDWAAGRATLCVRHDLFLLYDAAMEALLFDGRAPVGPLEHDGHGRAHGDRGLDVQGAPDDRLARGLDRRPGRDRQRRRLGPRLQHDRRRLGRPPRGRGGAARPAGARGGGEAELERRRDAIFERAPRAGRSCARRAAGRCWSTSRRSASTPAEASAAMLEAGVAATPMTGWGGDVAARHVRFVFSAEPVARLASWASASRPPASARDDQGARHALVHAAQVGDRARPARAEGERSGPAAGRRAEVGARGRDDVVRHAVVVAPAHVLADPDRQPNAGRTRRRAWRRARVRGGRRGRGRRRAGRVCRRCRSERDRERGDGERGRGHARPRAPRRRGPRPVGSAGSSLNHCAVVRSGVVRYSQR